MKILTWNVNSLNTLRHFYPWSDMKEYKQILDTLDADIICFQETKVARSKLDRQYSLVPGYDAYFSFNSIRKGTCGVVTYVRNSIGRLRPVKAYDGFRHDLLGDGTDFENFDFTDMELNEMDKEGRCVITDHGAFVLFNVYCPHETNEERLPFKMRFNAALQMHTESLIKHGRNVIIAGDINVARCEIDHCDPKKSIAERGLSHFGEHPPRKWLNQFCHDTVIDCFRHFHPGEKAKYTCWNTLINARPANFGTRIDYILVNHTAKEYLEDCEQLSDVMGSDHCPVVARLKDEQLSSYFSQDTLPDNYQCPPLCSKYFPEYRQKSIKDYFASSSQNSLLLKASQSMRKKDVVLDLKRKPNDTGNGAALKHRKVPLSDDGQRKLTEFFKKKNSDAVNNSKSGDIDESSPPVSSVNGQNAGKPVPDEFKTETEIENRKKWASIGLGKPKKAPNCYHGEPCKEFTVNKKGPNKGRRFYLCVRPVGPDGDKKGKKNEINEYRCDFFQWKNGPNKAEQKK